MWNLRKRTSVPGLVLIGLLMLLASLATAAKKEIEVLDAEGKVAASAKQETIDEGKPFELTFQRVFVKGDRIRFTGPQHLMIRIDALRECLLYSPKGRFDYPIPQGPELKILPPKSFFVEEHRVVARAAPAKEIVKYRNLALNTYASRKPAGVFPVASSNSEYNDMPNFLARNAIDGEHTNKGHGAWPHQSWGPDRRADLWWRVDFGQSMEIDKVNVTIRADFPHDAFWHAAVVEFSDGSKETIKLEKTEKPQKFQFTKRKTNWVRLTNLEQKEPLGWAALSEVEVWGRPAAVKEKK